MTRQIPLTKGHYTLVDDDDWEELHVHKWQWRKPPRNRNGYAGRISDRRGGKEITVFIHRLVIKARPGQMVDHINGDSLDNRKANLRFTDSRLNQANRKSVAPSSGFKGVTYHKQCKKWQAQINSKYLGLYKDPVEAAKAYDKAAISEYGEFARINFPDGETA